MEKNQTDNISETKQNLMDAYWDLYTADIPSKITVKRITDRAGYNRGTFYAYFLDIEDLHSQIEEELLPLEENFEKLREATFSKSSRQIVEMFMQMDKPSDKKLSFLLGQRGSLSFQNKLKSKLRELILKHAPLDLKDSDNVVDYKADMICSIFYETIRYWFERGHQFFSKEEMIDLMLKTIFLGVTEGQRPNIEQDR